MTDNVADDTFMDSSAPTLRKRRYVVHVYLDMEKSVQRAPQERIGREGLQHLSGQILISSEEMMESKSGRKTVTERRLFPGYIFVKIETTDEAWHLAKNTFEMAGFIGGTGSRPSPVSKSEVDKIMTQIQERAKEPRLKTLFEAGEMVRVKEDPFTDFSDNVEEVSYEKLCLRISVTVFRRATPVKLEFGRVEKV